MFLVFIIYSNLNIEDFGILFCDVKEDYKICMLESYKNYSEI